MKLLAVFLAVALVFTMMPLATGAVYANAQYPAPEGWGDNEIALTVGDVALTRDGVLSLVNDQNKVEGITNDNEEIVGVSLETIFNEYPAITTGTSIEIRSADYVAPGDNKTLVEGSKDTLKGYILVFQVNNAPLLQSLKNGSRGCFNLFANENGIWKRQLKAANVIVAVDNGSSGDGNENEQTEEPTEAAKVLIKGNVLAQEKEISEADVSSLIKKDVTFDGINRFGKRGAVKVFTGIYIEDLINYIGLKKGATIDHFVITTNTIDQGSSAQQVTEMSYNWLMTEPNDEYGNGKAMLAFSWEGKDKPVDTGTRVFVGAFDDMARATEGSSSGEYYNHIANKPNWINTLVSIEVVGTVPEPTPEPTVNDGDKVKVKGSTYTVTSASAGTVAFTKAKKAKTVTVPATIKINGKTFKVKKIKAKAFKGTNTRTVIVKTKYLTKKRVKGSLKGSKVKTIKVKVGGKKLNKKYVKKYKKIFTKKNAGKKVKVRR